MDGWVVAGIFGFGLALGLYLGAGIGFYDSLRQQDKRHAELNTTLTNLENKVPQHAAPPRVPRGWKIAGIISWVVGSLAVGVLIATYLIP